MNLIAFTGHSGVGKDTVANLVYDLIYSNPDLYPYHYAVSDYISEVLEATCDWPVANIKSARLSEPVLVRELLKATGNWLRTNDLKYLQHCITFGVDQCHAPVDYLLLSGIRFPDEVTTLINNYNATIIRITNPSIPIHDPSHDTVRHINDLPYHYVIPNTGSLDDLRATVTKLWNETRFSSVGRPLICPGIDRDGE